MAQPTLSTEPLEIAARLLELAKAAGADQADAVAASSTNASTTVRKQQIEKVSESTSRSVGLRVILGGRQATVSTSDISDAALAETVQTALELARVSEPDPFAASPIRGTKPATFLNWACSTSRFPKSTVTTDWRRPWLASNRRSTPTSES